MINVESYVETKTKELNNVISTIGNGKLKQKNTHELEKLKRCNKCEWSTDTGVSLYCSRLECVK